MTKKLTYFLAFLLTTISLNSCKDDEVVPTDGTSDFSSEVILSWVELTLQLTEETPGFSPPVAARVYGYSGLALYESVRHGMPGYKSLEGQITDFSIGTIPSIENNEEYHWGAVANATLGVFLKGCFKSTSAANLALMDDLEEKYVAKFKTEAPEEVVNRSIAYGQAVGNVMITFANSDGQEECYKNNFPASYEVPVGEGLWEPTSASTPIPLQPYWGNVRPFMEKNVVDMLPIAPPAFSTDPTSTFYLEAKEVYEVVHNLTEEQKKIAEFWSDDPGNTATPPGHSYSIMMQILKDENADLARTAEVYAKLGMGVHDAFVSCWHAKYEYNLIRPITYIHEHMDDTWAIPLSTPPFPEYTSGHSVQSGATAQILTDLFGDNYAFVDRTHVNRTDIDGSPRSFTSFFHFADEAAISRLYGGIHYRAAIEVGVEQGVGIGKNIATLKFQ
ncbi:vanadium-dependent haloperoxidase [Flammeovirgaceae bacterium SG7u.111]|nr:vanadium-dependent haloperoxidase [Flammeovirgaceae bacterium SG7u.132]WPO34106.1 vanadium-dependent haloperoxidase [Flammeovirgaceae bacterium SG7u.111]